MKNFKILFSIGVLAIGLFVAGSSAHAATIPQLELQWPAPQNQSVITPVGGGYSAYANGTTQSGSCTSATGCAGFNLTRIGLKSYGPFDTDFRFCVNLNSFGADGNNDYEPGFSNCTPWASDTLKTGGVGHVWVGWHVNPRGAQVGVETRALPAGVANISISENCVQVANGDDGWGDQFKSGHLGNFECATPGQEFTDYSANYNYSTSGGLDWLYLEFHTQSDNLAYVSSNFPSTYTSGQVVTAGTDGQALEMTVQNTGSLVWVASPSGSARGAVGTCTYDSDGDGVKDSPTQFPTLLTVGQTCTTTKDYSLPFNMTHISGSFGIQSSPEDYLGPVGVTKTVISQFEVDCDDGITLNAPNKFQWFPTAYAFTLPGGEGPPKCTLTKVYLITTTYSDPISIGPGANTTVTFSKFTAPVSAGSYTETWQANKKIGGSTLGPTIPFTFTVGGAVSGGTINITSENASSTSQRVSSNWNFAGSIADPCGGSTTQCSGTTKTYNGQPSGAAVDTYLLNISANPTGYSLRSINRTIAQAHPSENPILAFIHNFFTQAHAAVVCGFLNSNPSSCPNPISGLTLFGVNDTANFIILWNPIANMAPIANPITIPSSAPLSKVVTITNSGSAASTLKWTAGAPVYGPGASGWLTVSPGNGSVVAGTPGNVTFTANLGGLTPGTPYSATVKFTATSAPGAPPSPIPPQTVTVNFTPGGGSSPVIIISVTPSNTVPVLTPVTTKCSGGTGSYKWTASGGATPPSGNGDTFVFSYDTPSGASPYVVTCIDANNPNSTATADITVTQITPVCAFGASPTQITLPGSSTLSWTCTNAVSCTINGAPVANPISGTMSVSPLTNTTYTLSCQGPGKGPNSSSQVNTTVRVVGPGIIEGNP